jgi:S-adenosylmethionine decarboxylase
VASSEGVRFQKEFYETMVQFQNVSGVTGNIEPVGTHCILELYGCNHALLDDADYIQQSLRNAATTAGATFLKETCHRFDPQGVTALALLAESHISIHTWPESGYAAVDVFTCGDHTMPESACHHLIRAFESTQYSLNSLKRQPPAAIAETPRTPLAVA